MGPKNKEVEVERLLYAYENNDRAILRQTTLMIRNIPIKFRQQDMLNLMD